MAEKKINSLLDSAATLGVHFKYRVTKTKLKAIERDIKQLVAAEKSGRVLPSRKRIADYIETAHGVTVSQNTVAGWLNKVRKGQSI